MNFDNFSKFYGTHKGGINGALAGFAIAISILTLNIFRTVLILFFVVGGYYVGKKIFEDKEYFKKLLDRILPPGTFR